MSNGNDDDVLQLLEAWREMVNGLTEGMTKSINVSEEAWKKISDDSEDYDASDLMADMARGYAAAVNSMRAVGAAWNDYVEG